MSDKDLKTTGKVERAMAEKAGIVTPEGTRPVKRHGGEPSKAVEEGSILWKTVEHGSDLVPLYVTRVGDREVDSVGRRADKSTIHYAIIRADGSLGPGHYYAPWAFNRDVEEGRAGFIDGATSKTTAILPAEWVERLKANHEKARARQQAKMEDGRDPLHDREPEFHPSYGTITLTRGSHGGRHLFGSAFEHHGSLTLRVNRASLARSLSNDRTFAEGLPIIEIDMTEAQFAHFVTSVAQGEGTPCTIRSVHGQSMPEVPALKEVERFHEDAQKTFKVAGKRIEQAVQAVRDSMEKPNLGKKDREAILSLLHDVERAFEDSLPFTVKQFGERMEKIVADGKQEIEAYLSRLTEKAGQAALTAAPTLALTAGEDKDNTAITPGRFITITKTYETLGYPAPPRWDLGLPCWCSKTPYDQHEPECQSRRVALLDRLQPQAKVTP